MKALFAAGREGGSEVTVVQLTEPEKVRHLIGVFESIAQEQGWQPGDQLRTYQDIARHLAVVVDGEIAGGLQVVHETASAALPCSCVWPEVETGEASTAHVTILALKREHRGRPGLFGPLCVELWRYCVAEKVGEIVLEATPPTLRLYRRLGWPLDVIGSLRPHWGEECFLCRMGVQQVAEALRQKARRSPSNHRLVEQAYRDLPVHPEPI